MSTEAIAIPPAFSRLRINRVGLWLFIVSESFLFAALISSRYYLLGLNRPPELNQLLGLAISVVLLSSSLSAYLAERAIAHDDQSIFRRGILATISFGLIFLVGVGIEWAEAFTHFPPHTAFGTVFFTLTGLHATHVLSGVVLLLIVYFRGRNDAYNSRQFWGVEGSVKYWHFVDVVWLIIYPTLYLVS